MKQKHADYQLDPYPQMRRAMAVMLRSFQHKPMMHGLLEVDVTRARVHLRDHKAKTGESLSFTAFIIACVGKAVDENKAVQAYRQGQKHLVVFDDVDVATTIDREVAGQKVPLVYVIRTANHKTFRLTISFDHNIIDGAPAARFTQRLKDLIESGYGLGDSTVELEQTVAPGASKKN